MQLKINSYNEAVVEWIPYNQFDNIKEIGKGGFATVYSAIWKNGPLDFYKNEYKRLPNKKVALKYLHNSQNITSEFLNEVCNIFFFKLN
jgi:serine/threonine protein kinase